MSREKQKEGITLLGNNNTKYPQTYCPPRRHCARRNISLRTRATAPRLPPPKETARSFIAKSFGGQGMKALVLLSGGVDSATCLGLAVREYGAAEICLSLQRAQEF